MTLRANEVRDGRRVQHIILVLGFVVLLILAAGIGLSASDTSARSLTNNTMDRSYAPALTDTPIPTNTPTSCIPVWSVVSSPNVGNEDNYLYAVAAVSANDMWAVGNYCTIDCYSGDIRTLIEHWNGTAWSVVSSPDLEMNTTLFGVAAVSANNVWGVGYFNNGLVSQTLVEHWNGTAWSVVPSPNVGTHDNYLNGVAAVSANDVWAVGNYDLASSTLIEHWNGTAWSVVSSPNVGGYINLLLRVKAVSANDVWAVGYYIYTAAYSNAQTLVEHWNGTAWSVVPSPNVGTSHNDLRGVAVVSANDVWAVGLCSSGTLVEHWNGTAWSVVSSPSVNGGGLLHSVAVVSANDVWAVGCYSDCYEHGSQTLVEHWDGTSWSIVSSPNINGGQFFGVAVLSANNVWAVGHSYKPNAYQTLVDHYTSPCVPPCTGRVNICHLTGSPNHPYHQITIDCQTLPAHLAHGDIYPVSPNGCPAGTPPPQPHPFTDIDSGSPFYGSIQELYTMGAISGYNDGAFRPNNGATRAQLVKIVVLAFGIPSQPGSTQHFSDVPPDNLFFAFIETAYAHGLIGGYNDGTFKPNDNITRGQAAKVAILASGDELLNPATATFTDVPVGSTFFRFVETAYANGMLNGYADQTFKPNDEVTRGQLSKVVNLGTHP